MKKILILITTTVMIILGSLDVFASPCGSGVNPTDENDVCSWNIRVRPFYTFFTGVSLVADYQLDSHISIGPDLTYFKYKDIERYVLGINTIYYFSKMGFTNSGWTLTGNFSYGKVVTLHDDFFVQHEKMNIDTFSIEILGGYHWHLQSGFNFDLGLGVKRLFVDIYNQSLVGQKDLAFGMGVNIVQPTAEVSVGYSF